MNIQVNTEPRPRILIAEDVPLIAMDIEQAVEHLLAARTTVVLSMPQLRDAVTRNWDLVLIETSLRGESTAEIVDQLMVRGIPVIVCSADRRPPLPFASMPVVAKPFDWHRLNAEIEAALGTRKPGPSPVRAASAGHQHANLVDLSERRCQQFTA
jgi:CheY-like chemotaxis protein